MNWEKAVLAGSSTINEWFTRLPRAGNRLLEHLERDEPFKIGFDGTDRIGRLLDRLITRLSLSVLSAALIMGLAFLIPSTSSNQWIFWIVIAGFVLSVGLGLWLLISMLRSRF